MKPVYSVVPSDVTRIQGPRNQVDIDYLPYSVVRDDGSLLASFHSDVYAEKFSDLMNELVNDSKVEKPSGIVQDKFNNIKALLAASKVVLSRPHSSERQTCLEFMATIMSQELPLPYET